jgi:hypothetical protein
VESRITLEVEYAKMMHGTEGQVFGGDLAITIVAMASLDFDRALTMLNEIQQQKPADARYCRQELIYYLLASDEERMNNFLNQYGPC